VVLVCWSSPNFLNLSDLPLVPAYGDNTLTSTCYISIYAGLLSIMTISLSTIRNREARPSMAEKDVSVTAQDDDAIGTVVDHFLLFIGHILAYSPAQ